MKRIVSLLTAALLVLSTLCGCAPIYEKTADETNSDGGAEEEEYVEDNIVAKIPTQEQIDRFEQTVFDKTEKENVYIYPNTVKINQDADLEKNGVGILTCTLARNEYEGVQFILRFDEIVQNGYSVYTATVDNPTENIVEITVGNEVFRRILKAYQ